ncbi:hypothetical protein ACLOAV_009085 [Pseudogymnoascus australis]
MPSRDTIVVRNLPEKTTEGDIKTFFETRVRDAETIVFPLVNDSQRSDGKLKCATVELNHAVKDKALKFSGAEFIAAGGGKSNIEIDASLLGSITLAEHNNAQFDIYFVHGLGGDVFSSWVNADTHHMWARDSFPLQCINLNVRGRFSMIGFDAKVLDKKQKNIRDAAEEILNHVRADRPAGCTRPIFFVCHSLGGLVVTQALVLALGKPAINPEFQFIQKMVRGVVYFGTPFQGSINADFTAPLANLVGTFTRSSTNYLGEMRTSHANKLAPLMMGFNNIRNEEEIEVLVFVEKLSDGPTRVTTRTSATLPFTPPVVPIGINANHRDMVKFASGNEARETMTEIVNMIKRKLEIPIIATASSIASTLELLVLTPPRYEADKSRGRDDNTGFARLALFDTVFVIDDTGSMQMTANSDEVAAPGIKTRWDVLTNSMQFIGNIAAEYDPDGVDIYFLVSTDLNQTNIKSGQAVLNLLAEVDLTKGSGGTYFAEVLADILGTHVARYDDYFKAAKRREKVDKVRPLNVIVLTDGKANDGNATKKTIIKMGRKLDDMNAPLTQIGIQFLQVGDDNDAAKWLKSLDDDLEDNHDVRDYVDTRSFDDPQNSKDFTANLRQILLGAIDRDIDD